MRNNDYEFNIFYHNKRKLDQILNVSNFDKTYNFIDLNDLILPAELKISGLDPIVNKAIYSEYLGIMLVKPKSEMVGCFTYSIQTKFSARWALECGNVRFLPPIKFQELNNCIYESDKLYSVEMNSPKHLIPKQMEKIFNSFPLNRVPNVGPFKGSFIVSKKVFLELQKWLLSLTKYIISTFKMDEIKEIHSPFDKSALSERTPEELSVDKLRHTYGSVLERSVAYFLGARFDQDKVVMIGKLIQKRKKIMEFERTCIERAQSQDIIISFGNFAYKDVAFAWLKKLQDVGVSNYVFIAMDSELHGLLSQRGYCSVLLQFDDVLGELWVFRLKTIKRILDVGLNVLHSDVDAFWLKNPMPYLKSIQSDLISSQGTVFPHDCWKEWGFVLCCGFQYFRPSVATLAFFEELIPLVEEVKDDQTALNSLLLKHQTTWKTPNARYQLSINKKVFNCFYDPIYGHSAKNLKICLLPHSSYQRLLEKNVRNTYVLHLLSDKTQDSKIQSLKQIEDRLNTLRKGNGEIIWLASYPRSGNTLVRTILKYNFGLDNYSLYNDTNDIGKYKSIRDFVGHQDGNWGCIKNGHRQLPLHPDRIYEIAENRPVLIKTHSQYDDFYQNFKVIYVVRDPRSVLTSYVSYKQNFAGVDLPSEEILNDLIFNGDNMSGFWSEHVESWLSNKKERLLVLKYEDILSDFDTTLNQIASFIACTPINTQLVDFKKYQEANSVFFRKGKKNSWKDTLPVLYQEKIISSSCSQIQRFNYTEKFEENDVQLKIHSIGPSKIGKWIYICTPVLNAEKTIDQTIQSVISQSGDFFLHYHIQDGGSTDKTLDKLESWKSLLYKNAEMVNCSSLTFTYDSSPDTGIYDAINKAFRSMNITRNAIMSWINADDVLIPGAVETVATIFEQFPDENWIIPSPYTMGEQGSHIGRRGNGHPAPARSIAKGFCDGEHFSFIQQEGLFWKSDLWHRAGGLNLELKFAGDWDLWRRYALICAPLHVRYHLGIFRKRPGQLSENVSDYMIEVNRVKQGELSRDMEHIPDYRRLVSLGSAGNYVIESSINNDCVSKFSTDLVKESCVINKKSKTKIALSKYYETKLMSYIMEAAREMIKDPIAKNIKNDLLKAYKEKNNEVMLRILDSLQRSTS